MSESDVVRDQLKRIVEERLQAESLRITQRKHYEKYDDDEITSVLLKQDPNIYGYSSNDFWNLGYYRIEDLIAQSNTMLFYHYDKKKKNKSIFKPSLLSTYLQLKYPIVTIKPTTINQNDQGDMWLYDGETTQMYKPNAELKLGQDIKELWYDNFDTRLLNQTFANIRYETYLERNEFTLDPQYIPVQNGILWVHQIENEWIIDIGENTSELYVTSRIPTPYDPDAECPRWLKFLNEILSGQEKEIYWLQEYVGYCLYRTWNWDKVIMLLGDGDNGKSTLLEVIRALVGAENCPTIGLYDLCNGRWYLAELYLKLANIDADTATKDLENTSKFKTATGGDQIMGERKGKNPFFFNSYCKHFMSANNMPYCYDDTDAFYRRWFVIKFFEQFPEGDPRRDPQLGEKLLNELSGILNWALCGLLRLLKNNGFTNPPTTEEVKAEWNRLSNPLYAFIYSENVILDSEGIYSCQTFYEDFIAYAKKHKLILWTKDKIGKRITHHFDFIDKKRFYDPSEPDYRPWVWQGIRKPTGDELQEYMEDY